LPGLAFNCSPPNLGLQNSWDYSHESLCPGGEGGEGKESGSTDAKRDIALEIPEVSEFPRKHRWIFIAYNHAILVKSLFHQLL
jgi:hypothetical protein